MISSKETVLKITAGMVNTPAKFEIFAKNRIKSFKYSVSDGEITRLKGEGEANSETVLENFSFDADPWSVDSPKLYSLNLEITYANGERESLFDRFGFRYFSCDERYIYLNGYPFYMRGYIRGCAAHEHQNNCNLSEYDFYKKNILMAKSYGYNTIRFHSVIPPEACFKAADDLGIMIHIEMRRENDDYNNLEEMLYGKNDFICDEELLNTINSLYNHPSFMVYCVGNEIRRPGRNQRIREIHDLVKKHDATRLFIDTCAHGEYDRDCVDFDVQHMGYFFPYGRNKDMFSDTENLLGFGTVRDIDMISKNGDGAIKRGIKFTRPLIAHEVCHYTSWRDYYALKEKFQKFKRPIPWWVDEEIKMLEAKGYKENFKETLQITKDFQFRCWKTALESIRASRLLSGFHMLQFADTDKYENSNGVVDCFDDPHGISPDEFCKFNADTVILARLPKQIYAGGEDLFTEVLLSQYKINPPKKADFAYRVLDGGLCVKQGSLKDVDTCESGLYTVCSLKFKVPSSEKPQKYILECSLEFCDGTVCENSWEFWSFPDEKFPLSLNANCDMKEDYLLRTCKFTESSKLTVTDKLDDNLFDRLERGEDVMLIYRQDFTRHLLHKDMKVPKYSFRHTWDRFKGVIWDRGTMNGGRDEKEVLTKYGFVTDGQINFQYYNLIDDSDKINLDDFPVKVHSLVSGLDKSNRDRFDPNKFALPELMYDRTMRNFSYAFALKAGKGRLLVTGFNFTDIVKSNPAVISMLKTLVNYANSSDFAKEAERISVGDLKEYLSKIARSGPQKERMMTQYWQLDSEPVESIEYWRESERYLKE